MVPYAGKHNLRLVLLNLRDYKGSTLYSPEELTALASPLREVQARAIEERGLELATFLRWYIETEHIPPISETPDANGRLGGGVAVLGWSGGNYQTIPLVGSFRSLPEDTRKFLEGYFRALLIYGTLWPSIFYTLRTILIDAQICLKPPWESLPSKDFTAHSATDL